VAGAAAGLGGSLSSTGGATPGFGGNLATGGTGGQTTLNLELTIAEPSDDCTWIGNEERLQFSATEAALEVGTDAEMGRVGLRFSLPIAAGARIVSAILRVYRVAGDSAAGDTLAIQVFDAATVSPFDPSHMHAPAAHAGGGLWGTSVGGIPVGKAKQFTQTPDLSALVQHVLDKPDWSHGNAIGFVLAPESMSGWASYSDSASGVGVASLRLSYVPH
jgi:hypothetical protein